MKKLLFIGIIVLAACLRLYRLSDVPPGVNRDEASIGFTAYSLMTTGKDEYGRTFPLSFESFGDWKLPLYIYTTIPFVKIFGLNELAVRLPSALAGITSVVAIYYLTRVLFASEAIALFATAVLALNPWHIHICRVESEAIVAVLFTILGSVWFLRAIRQKALPPLIASVAFFAATYYTYHGNHVFTTLLLAGLTLIYQKGIMRIPRWWIALATGVVATLLILTVTFKADHTKISGISIFGDPTVIHTHIELPRMEHDNPKSLVAILTHNRVTYAVTTIVHNYLKSYGPEFLFIQGGGNRAHNIQGYGNLHPIEAPLLLLGIAMLFALAFGMTRDGKTRNESIASSRLVVWWILIGGVASAITKDAPHSNRMLAVVPAFAIAVAVGVQSVLQLVPKRVRVIITVILIAGYVSFMSIYLDRYYVHFPKTEAGSWGYAYKQLVPILFSGENMRSNVIMTRPETSPYIYLLFYGNYSPSGYQKEAKRYPISSDGFTDVEGFGRFSFRAIDWDKDLSQSNTLLVARPDEVPDSYDVYRRYTVKLPDGSDYWYVLSTP